MPPKAGFVIPEPVETFFSKPKATTVLIPPTQPWGHLRSCQKLAPGQPLMRWVQAQPAPWRQGILKLPVTYPQPGLRKAGPKTHQEGRSEGTPGPALKSPHVPQGAQRLAGFQVWRQHLGSSDLVPSGQWLHVVIKGLADSCPCSRPLTHPASQDQSVCQHVLGPVPGLAASLLGNSSVLG